MMRDEAELKSEVEEGRHGHNDAPCSQIMTKTGRQCFAPSSSPAAARCARLLNGSVDQQQHAWMLRRLSTRLARQQCIPGRGVRVSPPQANKCMGLYLGKLTSAFAKPRLTRVLRIKRRKRSSVSCGRCPPAQRGDDCRRGDLQLRRSAKVFPLRLSQVNSTMAAGRKASGPFLFTSHPQYGMCFLTADR